MGKIKVLVVEDESLVARDVHHMLVHLGYDVPAVCSTGELALKKTEETSPDLVLMDIVLKGGMDGITTAEEIRKQFRIPVIYLTAYADEATLQRAKVTEPSGYILKPVEERELSTIIETALYKHKMERKIQERERWLATILQSIADAVIVTDREGRVTFMNPIAEGLTGVNQDEGLGKDLEGLIHFWDGKTGDAVRIPVRKILKEGRWIPAGGELVLINKRLRIPVEGNATLIRDEKESVAGIVLVFRDITERKRQEEKLAFLAIHDSLTGLPNRVLFNDRLALALAYARRNQHHLAVMMLDLDRFKDVNDTFGHSMGDKLLRAVAERLKSFLRKSDTVARLGGDEFLLLLPDISHKELSLNIAQRILQSFQEPFDLKSRLVRITTSIGIAVFPEDGDDDETLIRNADKAMYQAKEAGRNNWRCYAKETEVLRAE